MDNFVHEHGAVVGWNSCCTWRARKELYYFEEQEAYGSFSSRKWSTSHCH